MLAINIDLSLNCHGGRESIGSTASSALARAPAVIRRNQWSRGCQHFRLRHRFRRGTACGCIFLIRSDPARAHLLGRPARAALAAADSVLHDDDIDPRILALVPHSAFVEPVASDSDCTPAKSPAIARARKLAFEGWRVVWLVSGDDWHPPRLSQLAAPSCLHGCLRSRAASRCGQWARPEALGDRIQRPRRLVPGFIPRAVGVIPGRVD
jgi:hypothetical protein